MADLQVIAAVHRVGRRIVFVVFGILPMAACREMVDLVAQSHRIVQLPRGLDFKALVFVVDIAVGQVVVVVTQRPHYMAIHSGRAEIARRCLVADIGGGVHRDVAARCPAQRGHQLAAAGVVQVTLAIRALAIGVDAVAQRIAQGAGRAQAQARCAKAPAGHQDFGRALAARRFTDSVDGSAHGAAAVHQRGRAAQHVNPLIAPAAVGVRHGARRHTQCDTVFCNADRVHPTKTPAGKRQAAVARFTRCRQAHAAGDGIDHAIVGALGHLLGRYATHAGRQV